MAEDPGSICSSHARQLNGTETILVCDDEQIVLESTAFLLSNRGYTVLCAGSGSEAIKAAAAHAGKIDLLLTDVNMPGMNGWQLAKELADQRPDMKVLFVSGDVEDVYNAGASRGEHIEFVEKPAQGDTLFRRIRDVLDSAVGPACRVTP